MLLIWISQQFRLRGWRELSAFCLQLVYSVCGNSSVLRQLVIDLLVLGRANKALRKMQAALPGSEALESFSGQKDRFLAYINWKEHSKQIALNLYESREQIVSHLRGADSCLSSLLGDLSSFSDYILVSNARVHFSGEDVNRVRAMSNPLFVFLNHANPGFQESLLRLGLQNVPHLLLAGKNGLVSHSLRLMYKEYSIYDFDLIGCLVRNGLTPHFKKYYLADVVKVNKDVDLFCIDDIALLIDETYQSGAFLSRQSFSPMASAGWLAIELFGALAELFRSIDSSRGCRSVWLVGFDLSPSYVFESGFGNVIHDFVYEYCALQVRLHSSAVKSLGRPAHRIQQKRPPVNRLTNKQMWALRS